MGEVSKLNASFFDESQVRNDYAKGRGANDGKLSIGIEIESWLVNTQAAREERIKMMSSQESQAVLEMIASADPQSQTAYEINGRRIAEQVENAPRVCVESHSIMYQLELCGVLEAAGAPIPADELTCSLQLISRAQTTIINAAKSVGLSGFNAAFPGSISIKDCAENMVARERLTAEWEKFSLDGTDSPGLRTMGLATSAQVSIGYRDPQEAGEIIKLGNLLAPAFYAAFANSTGYVEGQRSDLLIPRADWWMQHNRTAPRAGIPISILKQMFARNGENSLLDTWINHVQQVPMVYYWDEQGAPRFDTSPTFKQLLNRGLGTQQNFALAESLLWPDVKVIGGQRIELRAADSGFTQPAALAVLASEVFASPLKRRAAIKDILEASKITAETLQSSREQVARRGAETPFGRTNLGHISSMMAEWIRNASNINPDQARSIAASLNTGKCDIDEYRPNSAVQADLLRVKGL